MLQDRRITPELLARFERALGQPVTILDVIRRGYTPALRLRVRLQDGSTAFIKCATTLPTAEWLCKEYAVYTTLKAPFLCRMIAWEDQGEFPFLVLEDLSAAAWPPPWTARQIGLVRDMLVRLAALSLPGLLPIEDERAITDGWQEVAADPDPFLSLGFASRGWLERALPTLLAIDGKQVLHGESLLHTDVRSDNLCFLGDRVILIDWNCVCIGHPSTDLAFWLPSLEMEGGPAPEALLPDGGPFAAVVSGYFAAHAGLPVIPDAPRVRQVQLAQLRSALPWAVRALGLPPLDGARVGGK
jgi:Phosphotransferase enzyme family